MHVDQLFPRCLLVVMVAFLCVAEASAEERTSLGIMYGPPSQRVAANAGVTPDRGALIRRVAEHHNLNGDAQQSLQPGDLILMVNWHWVMPPHLSQQLQRYQPGETIVLTVHRNDRFLNLRIKLSSAEAGTIDKAAMQRYVDLQMERYKRRPPEKPIVPFPPQEQAETALHVKPITDKEALSERWTFAGGWAETLDMALELNGDGRFRFWYASAENPETEQVYPIIGTWRTKDGLLTLWPDVLDSELFATEWIRASTDTGVALMPMDAVWVDAGDERAPWTRMLIPVKNSVGDWPILNEPIPPVETKKK